MSQYLVMTPDYEIVRIQGKQRVTEYIQQYYSGDMLNYCKDREMDYDELSIQNVRDMGLLIGGTDHACKIYALQEVVRKVKETLVAKEDQQEMTGFLQQLVIERAVKCPGDLSDLLTETDEIYPPELLDSYGNQVETDK